MRRKPALPAIVAMAAAILMLGVYDVSAQKLGVSAKKPGTKKWTFTSSADVCTPVALGPTGTVYVGTYRKKGSRGSLIALNANGKMRWERPLKAMSTVSAPPVVGADGTVYVISDGGILYAVRPTNSIKWELPIRGSGSGRGLALGHDGTIYVLAKPSSMVAIGPDGAKKWTFRIELGRGSPLVGPNGTIYVGSKNKEVLAINPDGTQKAKFPGLLTRGGAVDWDGTLYLNMGGELRAKKPDGTKAWTFPTGPKREDVTVPVIGPSGTIYAANDEGALYAFRRDGTRLWGAFGNWSAGRYGNMAYPAIGSDGTIYVGTEQGKLYAFTSKGAKKWEADSGRSYSPWPVIGPDGTVYVGTGHRYRRGEVVAFHTGC